MLELLDRHGSALPLPVELTPALAGEAAAEAAEEESTASDIPHLRAACNAAIAAAYACGDTAFAERVRQLMIQRGLTPDGSTFDALIASALRRGAGAAVVEVRGRIIMGCQGCTARLTVDYQFINSWETISCTKEYLPSFSTLLSPTHRRRGRR